MATNIAVFGAFVLIVAVLGFFLWQTLFASKEYSYGEEKSEPAYSEQQTGNEYTSRSSSTPNHRNATDEAIAEYTKWLAIFTLFLVLATIGLFISGERNVDVARRTANAAKQSADATRASVKLAEQTAEMQLRAYVFLDPEKIFENLSVAVGEQPHGMLRVKNFGLTPAYKLIALHATANGPWPLPDDTDLTIQPTEEGAQIAAPGAVTFWGFGPTPNGTVVTAEDFAAFRSGRHRFYVYGRITYEDAFGKPRYTNFCLAIVPPQDPSSGAGFGIQRCKQHNDAN
jgi:hypothetical protein